MRYFLVAGETSGDMHAASLMKGLLAVDPEAEFSYFGGDAMAAVAPGMVMHCRDLAIMGFWEVLMGLRKILRNLKTCLRAIEDFQPDVVILVDFPGFNFRVAKACKERGLPVYYYIAPKVWAWKERRVERIRAYVDRLFIIFPFEVEYFRGKGIEAIYEGNPLLDELNISPLAAGESEEFFALHALDDRPKVALLPGSRVQEIRATLQRMGDLSVDYPDYQFVIAAAPSISVDEYAQVLDEFPDLAIVHGDTPG
ncbi:MAG: lipid-A-disaccharide synthase, partial [Bacteroidetes bacterium]